MTKAAGPAPKHYLFVYGSLMSRKSRKESLGFDSLSWPAVAMGFRRRWAMSSAGRRKRAFLALEASEGAWTNGLLIALPFSAFSLIDAREGPGYARHRMEMADLLFTGQEPVLKQAGIWVYLFQGPESPTLKDPLAQSYLDVVLEGTFEYGEAFSRAFISNTQGWEAPWVNDRKKPLYSRALKGLDTEAIDAFLLKSLPQPFKNRREVRP